MAEHAVKDYDAEFEEFEKKVEHDAETQKTTYSKLVVALCLMTVISYTVTCFVYLWNGKPLNDALTILFFGCFGLEFASLAFIKGRKIKYVGGNAANKQMAHVEPKEDSDDEGRPDQKAHQD